MEHQTDNELMQLVQAGDPAQLAVLFERHHVSLFRYLYQLTRNRAISEDLAQEVFLRVLKYAPSFKSNMVFRSWLFGMARNASRDARHKVRKEIGDVDMTNLPSRELFPDEEIAQHQNARILQQALNRLPDDRREILELSRFQALPYDEIAAILRCEVGAVKTRVYRALQELRTKFFEISQRQIA